ncbi:baculoviral IAP repeat-containing protein 8-like [Mercenaria mercenaria]|uniref:baculoviral IAP repeat-containing protein 8-like n=1 Tax=Mercenaria mercenaria TaxID=6596 RepID=UPI00234E3856|nr:baculoviral IAP repeat-containing protein 8-like [Mercenaria mercenaria]
MAAGIRDIGQQNSASIATEALQQDNVPPSAPEEQESDPGTSVGGRTDPTITVVVSNPKHPDYVSIDSRVSSYQGWPDYLDQTPRQMSEAGFFFVGVADFTRCFCCGGGLRNWEPGDDPMLEHTRWFPHCEYVSKLKGERYVAAVQRRHQEHMLEQQRQQTEIAQRRDELGIRPPPTSASIATSVLSTCTPSSIVYTGTNVPSSVVYTGTSIGASVVNTTSSTSTATSIVNAGTTTSTVSSASTSATARVQKSGTSASATAEGSSSETENQQTVPGNSSSFNAASGAYVERQSGASGGDGNESRSAAAQCTYLIEKENEELKERLTCKICLERPINRTFLPCGHLVSCETCAPRLKRCPICRKRITGKVKTFMY